jgi:hypothetical protein
MLCRPSSPARRARWSRVIRMTTCFAVAAMAAIPATGVATTTAASERPPMIELEPGLDTRCVAQVDVDSARLVRAVPQWWSRQFRWEGVHFHCDRRTADGTMPFTWNVPGLGISGRGEIVSAGDGAVRWQWHLTAEKPWPVEGEPGARQPHGGLTFFLDLKSPARRGCSAAPVLKADRTGFAWEVTPGRTVEVRFSAPLAALYFERGNKSEIRCMFYDAPIAVGRLEQSMTISPPQGGVAVAPLAERYAADDKDWFTGALDPHAAFIDLSYLNDKPAGRHGFLQAKGSELVFADGTPARLWGFSVQAGTLYVHTKDGNPDRELIDRHARRLAQLGANLVRLTHVDSDWVHPQLIAPGRTTENLDDQAVNTLFYWIKALKEQGIYVWVDMITYRPFLAGDNIPGFDEISAHARNKQRPLVEGYSYLNPRIEELWCKTSKDLVTRVNPYTGLALKDDPAVAGLMIWNENDLTGHFGLSFLPDKNNPWHRKLYLEKQNAFVARTGLKPADLFSTWLPGAGKLFLNDLEYDWNHRAAEHLRGLGVKAPICSGHLWGNMPCYSLAALTAGDVIDSHVYTPSDFLGLNPRYAGGLGQYLAMARLADRPKIVSEYNMEDNAPKYDPFTVAPYISAMAAFQGWSAIMLYGYSQDGLRGSGYSMWSVYSHPQSLALAPAAALLYREGHVRPAARTVFVPLSREQAFFQDVSERTSRTLRTVPERHRLMLGLPAVKELPWLKPTAPPPEAEIVTDLDRDFIPPGDEVVSDTGQLRRNWTRGSFVVDTPKTQMVMGWMKGDPICTADASFSIAVPKAAVALSSLDRQPLRQSKKILVSTIARMTVGPDRKARTEPVAGTIVLQSTVKGHRLIPLKSDGTRMSPIPLETRGGKCSVVLPTDKQTHWFLLEEERPF